MNKTNSIIDGLVFEPKKIFADTRGSVMHMAKVSELGTPIAEVYFSTVKPGVTKGWKCHKKMWQRFAVPVGEIEFKFVDERIESSTRDKKMTVRISKDNYQLVIVPPGIWYSFQCVSDVDAMIVNAASLEHDPTESETRPLE